MSVTAVVVIAFAIAMVVGPVMLMRPSPSQVKLANLRNLALKAGCRVRMAKHPWDANLGELACYSLPWPTPQQKQFQEVQFALFKRHYVHDIHFYQHWDYQQKNLGPLNFDDRKKEKVKHILAELPANVYGIEINKLGVALCLKEKLNKPEPETIADCLLHLKALQAAFIPAAL